MPRISTDTVLFTLSKVKAYRAYFTECRNAAKGAPEFNDLDTTVKLCEQLVVFMSEKEPDAPRPGRKPAVSPPA